ncbi:U-box domain-containing protein, partial [Haematococcus lacustris]
MQEFDDKLPKRQFDNFQFVNFTEVQRKYGSHPKLEAQFALQALMELPEQYKLIQSMGMLSRPVNQRIPGYPPMNPPAPSRWGPAGPAGDAAGSSSIPVAMGQPVPYYQQPSMGPGLAGSQYPSMH